MSVTSSIIQTAKETLQNEAQALLEQIDLLSDGFEQAVKAILATSGKVVVSGMGKSGIIGKKIAATLASTGTPSFFLHPAEAFHGDLGMVDPQDLVLLLSNSGETDEVLKILPFFKENGNVILAMSARTDSTLAQNAHHHIWVKIHEEACPLKLAPTTSTTVMLAMGDAMAVALMREKGFMEENYARFHPGGSLGRKLLAKVGHKMRTENLPLIQPDSTLIEIIQVISEGRLGLALVNEGNRTTGIITDGDLRRLLEREGPAAWNLKASQFMTPNPKTITATLSLHEAEEELRKKKITSLIVVDAKGDTAGIIQIYDLH